EPVNKWVQEHWASQQLTPEMLIGACQQVCHQALGEPVEKVIAEITEPFAPRGRWARGTYDSSGAFQALNKLVQLVGPPSNLGSQSSSGRLEQVVIAHTDGVMKDAAVKVAQLAICLIEQPDFRLAGAEVAIQMMEKLVTQVRLRFEPQVREQAQQAERAFVKLQKVIESDTRRKAGAEVAENLRLYA